MAWPSWAHGRAKPKDAISVIMESIRRLGLAMIPAWPGQAKPGKLARPSLASPGLARITARPRLQMLFITEGWGSLAWLGQAGLMAGPSLRMQSVS